MKDRKVVIFQDEFDIVMDQFGAEAFQPRGTSEIVYRIPLVNDLSIWVYSTIYHKTGVSRKPGTDAIRTIMLYQENQGVMNESKTLRTINWEKTLVRKIKSLQKRVTNYRCPWGHPLVKRKRKKGRGKFYDCATFPKCRYIYQGEKKLSEIYDPLSIPPKPENLIQKLLRRIGLQRI